MVKKTQHHKKKSVYKRKPVDKTLDSHLMFGIEYTLFVIMNIAMVLLYAGMKGTLNLTHDFAPAIIVIIMMAVDYVVSIKQMRCRNYQAWFYYVTAIVGLGLMLVMITLFNIK